MLGSFLRPHIQRPMSVAGRFISLSGISPNIFTLLALGLAAVAAFFFARGQMGWGLLFQIAALLWDNLDGAVAQAQKRVTAFGNYLDAMIDKYVEVIIYAGLFFGGYAIEAFLVTTGSLILSYAKPRTALVIRIDNHDWPAIGDRADRTILLVMGIIAHMIQPVIVLGSRTFDVLSVILYVLAALVYIGGIGRILYAKRLIEAKEPH